MENNVSMLNCLELIKIAIKENDKDMLQSYLEQLNDLAINFLSD